MDKAMAEYISGFRSDLMMNMPFYGEILAHIDVAENNDIPTACTNGRVIYYNSSFMRSLNAGQRNYVILHELMHIILLHFKVQGHREEPLWNVASDYVVNGLLDDMLQFTGEDKTYNGIRIEHPDKGCFMTGYKDQSVEQLYYYLYADNKKNGRRPYVLQIRDGYGGPVKLKPKKCKMGPGDYDIIFDLTPEEAKQLEKEINRIVEEALKHWSNDPSSAHVARELSILKHANRLPWKTLLKRFLTEADIDDTTYDHPERKYLHMELILPGVGTESIKSHLEDIWAFIDISGSISSEELSRFITELYNICRQFDSTVNIGFWHTSMEEIYRDVDKKEILRCVPQYSGGTDVNAVYDYLEENKLDPKVMLILTDGQFAPVNESRTRKYRKKTIVVLSDATEMNVENMGKTARIE